MARALNNILVLTLSFTCLDLYMGSQGAVLQTGVFITRFDEIVVVRHSIHQRSGHFRVAKNTLPFREAQVDRDDHAGLLV